MRPPSLRLPLLPACAHADPLSRTPPPPRSGSWSAAEEQELTQHVQDAREKMAVNDDKDSDVFWGEISKLMEYRRSRQQCRTKWCVPLADLVARFVGPC